MNFSFWNRLELNSFSFASAFFELQLSFAADNFLME